MKNINLISIAAAVSGGMTGFIVYLSIFGLTPSAFNIAALIGLIIFFSLLATVLLLSFSFLFALVFGHPPEKELVVNGPIFSIPAFSVLALPVYIKFYSKLSSLHPSVFGNIYIPFHGYVNIDMAKFFLINTAVAAWLAVFFILAIRFIKNFHSVSAAITEKQRRRIIFLFAFIFYIFTTSFVTFIYPPTGDEPHYLIIARSIAADLDVNLENNYTDRKEYEKFYPVALDYKDLHTTPNKAGRGVYTTHDYGLPLLIAPFEKFPGRYPVQFFMNLTAALFCVMLYMMLARSGISIKNSAAAAMTACICMPVIAGASLVLTEVPAALLVTYSVYTLMGGTIGKRNLLFFSAIAFLPWLHLKLIIFPPVFYICYYCFLFRNKQFNLKTELMNNLPVLLSVSLYLWFYYAAYGVIAPFGVKELHENIYAADPSLQQNKFVITPLHFIISGLAALFDRDYGLIPYCLLYITAIWGIMLAVRKKQSSMFIPLLLCAPYALIFLMWKDWTGSMTPARQLIPVVFVFVFYAIYFLDSTVFIRTKFFKILAIISFFVSWLLTAVPSLRYGASKDKIFNFLSLHMPRQFFWILPPFRDNITAGIAESLIYLAIIIISYHYILNKKKTR